MRYAYRRVIGMLAVGMLTALPAAGPAMAEKQGKAAPPAAAEYAGPMGYGMGPGMMHGWGGQGMGPGMMRGWDGGGMGPEMMYGWAGTGMMGPGMMRGWGGPGMMHGWGAGVAAYDVLDLSDEQQAQINKIEDETRKIHWAFMGTMMEERAKLRDLYLAREPDHDAIGRAYKSLNDLRQKMLESSLDAQKRMDAVLSKEQRAKLRSYQRRGW